MPRIKIVSHWEDSEQQAFVRNATRIKAIWLRHGAENFHVDRLHLGQHVGAVPPKRREHGDRREIPRPGGEIGTWTSPRVAGGAMLACKQPTPMRSVALHVQEAISPVEAE